MCLLPAADGPIVRQRVQWMAAFVLVCHWLLSINRVTSEIVQRAVLGLPRKQRYIRTRPLPLPYGCGRYSEKNGKIASLTDRHHPILCTSPI